MFVFRIEPLLHEIKKNPKTLAASNLDWMEKNNGESVQFTDLSLFGLNIFYSEEMDWVRHTMRQCQKAWSCCMPRPILSLFELIIMNCLLVGNTEGV